MRDLIKNKFSGIKQKWIYIPLDSPVFSSVLDTLTSEIRVGNILAKDAITLIKAFRNNKKAWIKFVSVKGRKNQSCSCEVILESNKKIKTELPCEFVLNAELMGSTPKGLKLFKKSKRQSKDWKKPDDGFIDDIQYPPVEEELTEDGYALYKAWQEEIKASGMSAEEYKRKVLYPHGYTVMKVNYL